MGSAKIKELYELRNKVVEAEKEKDYLIARLKDSRDRFKFLADIAFEPIVMHQMGKVFIANKPFCDLVGYDLEDVMNMDAFDFLTPQEKGIVKKRIEEGVEYYSTTLLREDGSLVDVKVRAREVSGNGIGMMRIVTLTENGD